jgi:hypothetical protein
MKGLCSARSTVGAKCELMDGHQGMHVSHVGSEAWWRSYVEQDNRENEALQGKRGDDLYND